MTSSDTALLVLRLSVGLMFAVIDGIDLSFNVYAVVLKETFNFTQTQVEITASMNSIGYGLAFIGPLLTSTCGYTTTFIVTWIAFPLSCGLFSLAAVQKDFFHRWPVFVYLFELMLNTASNMCYMVVTRACLEIVPRKYTGAFIGLFGAAVCFGKIFFAGLFDIFFHDDMAGFFLCLTVLFSIVLGACYILIYPVARSLETNVKEKSEDENEEGKDCKIMPLRDVLRSPTFHMMFWSVTLFAAASDAILNNITYVTDSLGVSDPFQTVTNLSLCIMATRLLCGIVFGKFSSMPSGISLMLTGYVSLGAGLYIGMFHPSRKTMALFIVLCGFGIGTSMYLPLAVLVHQFGKKSYSFLSCSFFALTAIALLLFQLTMGIVYDATIYQRGSTDNFCYGTDCFFWSFAFMFCVTVLIVVIQTVNLGIHVKY